MIRLATLLKEVAKNTPTPEEQRVIDDLLGSLQEGAFDNLLAKAKSYAKKGLLTATVIAALVASPELTSAQKSQIQDFSKEKANAIMGTTDMNPNNPADVKRVDTGYMKWTLGTSDDGILGQYTSQFIFPGTWAWKGNNALAKQGTETNKKLLQLSGLSVKQMEDWNKFVDWMKKAKIDGKKISGNPQLDTDPGIGIDVINAYKETPGGKGFWVNGEDELKQVQRAIKIYRDITVDDWKAGATDPKGAHAGIVMPK